MRYRHNLKLIMVVAILAFLIMGCSDGGRQRPQDESNNQTETTLDESTNQSTDPSEQEGKENDNTKNEDGSLVKSIEIEALEALVVNGATVSDVASFIKEHIQQVAPEEADAMLAILLKMQTGIIQASHEGLLYQEGYLSALNETMGGILDPEKIQDIEDEGVRNYYQSVYDSYLTMVRYEETPVVETDWSRVATLGATFTQPTQMSVAYGAYRDLMRSEDVDVLVDRVYAMEGLLENTEMTFGKEQLISRYSDYVSNLLGGPEGSYVYRLRDQSDPYTKKMVNAIDGHLESGFAQTAKTLITASDMDEMSRFQFLSAYRSSNPYIDYKWTERVSDAKGYSETLLTFEGIDDDTTNRVNDAIMNALDDLVSNIDEDRIDSVSMYRLYDVTSIASISYFINYRDDQDTGHYKSLTLNIDLSNGRVLALEMILDQYGDALLSTIESLTGTRFSLKPDFSMISTGAMLTAVEGDDNPNGYAVITYDVLLRRDLESQE